MKYVIIGIILMILVFFSFGAFVEAPRLGKARNDFCESIGYETFSWLSLTGQRCNKEEGNKIIVTEIHCPSESIFFKYFTMQPIKKEDLNCKQIEKKI
ncbi:hypothetical protein LCGC14_1215090 [marine sediment metagenome]|uniref:Uncharacterized protein n=1 Tax=marine sediment metagenome TaxID=412755 RepID=A0A0F9LH52_9ZZZZ